MLLPFVLLNCLSNYHCKDNATNKQYKGIEQKVKIRSTLGIIMFTKPL